MGELDTSVERGLLSHVEALTRHRDTMPLNVSVLTSLKDLLGLGQINLFDVVKRAEQYKIALAAWLEEGEVQCNIDFPTNDELDAADSHPAFMACLAGRAPALTEIKAAEGFVTCLPVVLGDDIAAFFEVHTEMPLNMHQRDVIEGVIGVYRNYLSLLRESQHDELTGLLNRRTFDHGMASLLSAARKANGNKKDNRRNFSDEFWLAVIDIDYFKRINDQFGHLYGDEVLILMANLMRKSFRQHDRLYRFGGEEFVVLMRHIDFDNVNKTLERFLATVDEYAFPQIGKVTVSIGFAPIRYSELASVSLGNADEALYYAKSHGRNQVQCYTILLETGRISPKLLHKEADLF